MEVGSGTMEDWAFSICLYHIVSKSMLPESNILQFAFIFIFLSIYLSIYFCNFDKYQSTLQCFLNMHYITCLTVILYKNFACKV